MHFRKDSPNGITPPNPDGVDDIVSHITKHRGMKTSFTSVSESADCVRHFSGQLYSTLPAQIIESGHLFHSHPILTENLKTIIQQSRREERILAQRALQYAEKAREALIDWKFDVSRVERKDRINWCGTNIQQFFKRV